MASKLLNVLDKIEEGRQDCVRVLKNLGFELSDNASFEEIAEEMEDNIDAEHIHFYIDSNMNNQYYDNPLDDPIIIKPTTFEKSFVEVLKQAPTVTFNDQIFYPCCLFLFSETPETSNIKSSQYVNPNTNTNDIRLGYQTGWGVVTSDGASYYMASNTANYAHTWDTSKDLIDPTNNKHYRYVIGYVRNNSSYLANTGIGKSHSCKVAVLSTQLYSYNQFFGYTGKDTNVYVRYLDHLDNAPQDNMTRRYPALGAPVAMFEIDEERAGVTATSVLSSTIICQSFINNNSLAANNVSFLSTITYVRVPVFKLNYYQSGDSSNHCLKYVEITNPERQAQLGLTLNVYMPPLLKDIEPVMVGFTGINQDCFKYFGAKKELILEKVTTLNGYAFRGCGAHMLSLPSYVSHTNANAFYDSCIQILDLPAITHLDTAINFNTGNNGALNTLREIRMEELLDATANITIGPKLTTLYLPKCTSFPQAMIQSARSLVNLTIGRGFKGNLNLLYCGNLSKDSWIDLFDKLAELEEGESYTLTLPSKNTHISNSIYPTTDMYQVAKDKGWTVSISG